MSKILVIDCHHLGHRAKHSMQGLSYREQETGVIFGFLNDILSLAQKFNTNRFVFCWDSKASKRKELYSGYKSGREVELTQEEIDLNINARTQFRELRLNILPSMGFKNILFQSGYEADDLIASVVMDGKKEDLIVVSRDNDLYQLLEYCDMYDIQNKKMFTEEDFRLKWKINPSMWAEVKAIAGCSSDSVPNVEGVKEITAIKYLQGILNPNHKTFKKIESKEGQQLIFLNRQLVTLPLLGTKKFELNFEERFPYNAFMEICQTYGLKSFVTTDRFPKWKKYFNME